MKLKEIILFSLLATASLHAGPLHYAAYQGNETLIRELLEEGCSVDDRDDNGQTPLHLASYHGDNPAIAQLLIDYGASVHARCAAGATPLHEAAYWGCENIVRLLIENGAALDASDHGGIIPLHWAAVQGHTKMTQLLLYKSFSEGKFELLLRAKNIENETAADIARVKGHQEIYELLTDEDKQREAIEQVHTEETTRKKAAFLESLKAQGLTVESHLRQRALGLNPRLNVRVDFVRQVLGKRKRN